MDLNFKVTILILIDGFLQYKKVRQRGVVSFVTILILIDGFLQYNEYGIYEPIQDTSQSLF